MKTMSTLPRPNEEVTYLRKRIAEWVFGHRDSAGFMEGKRTVDRAKRGPSELRRRKRVCGAHGGQVERINSTSLLRLTRQANELSTTTRKKGGGAGVTKVRESPRYRAQPTTRQFKSEPSNLHDRALAHSGVNPERERV